MGRLLHFLSYFIGAIAVLMVLRHAVTGRQKRRERSNITHPMVQCAHCGLHLPESEALFGGKQPYCTEAHRQAGQTP